MLTYALVLATISCTVAGNLLLKAGAERQGIYPLWPLSILNVHVIAGAACFGLGLLFYTMVLKKIPLNIAQSVFSIQFVVVIIASSILLGESIPNIRWIGFIFVGIGLFIIGWSVKV